MHIYMHAYIHTYILFNVAANDLRENYTSCHTFEKSIANHYKVNPGSVVVFNADRFHSKHEPKWHIIELKVNDLSHSKMFNGMLSIVNA